MKAFHKSFALPSIYLLFFIVIAISIPQKMFAQKEAKDYFAFYEEAWKKSNWSAGIIYMNDCIKEVNNCYRQYSKPDLILSTAYFYRGDCYINLNKYKEALADYKKSYDVDKKNANSLNYSYWAGKCNYLLSHYCDALEDFEKFVTQSTSVMNAYSYISLCCIELKDFNKALSNSIRSINLKDNDAVRYYVRGQVYYYLGEYQNSLDDYYKAISLDSSFAENLKENIAYDKAMLNPVTDYDYYMRGIRYSEEDTLYSDAINEFTKAINMNNDSALYYMKRGDCYYYLKDYISAKTDYETGLYFEPNNCLLIYRFGNLAVKEENNTEAIKYYTRAINGFCGKSRQRALIYCKRGSVYFNENDLINALDDFNKANVIDDNYYYPYVLLGKYYSDIYQHNKALEYYSEALKLDCKNSDMYLKRGFQLYSLNKFDDAILDFNKAIEIDKSGYVSRGVSYIMELKFDEALKDLKTSLENKPSDYGIRSLIGCMYALAGDCSKSKEYFNIKIEINKDNSDILSNMAFGYNLCGNYTEAYTFANKVIELNPTDIFNYVNRAYANGKLGKYKEAFKDYDLYLSKYSENCTFYWFRGITYFDMGKYKEAVYDLEYAVKLNPYFDKILRKKIKEAKDKIY